MSGSVDRIHTIVAGNPSLESVQLMIRKVIFMERFSSEPVYAKVDVCSRLVSFNLTNSFFLLIHMTIFLLVMYIMLGSVKCHMSSESELREAENEMKEATPSRGLQNQIPPDEEVQWVVEQDLRTAWFSLILHKIKFLLMMLIVGVVGTIAAMAFLGPLGVVVFPIVGLGVPAAYIGYKFYYLKRTNIEYAATDEQFLKYKNTPSTTKTDSLRVNRSKDAKFTQDIWDKFLDTGNIRIRGINRAGNMSIKDVPNAEAVHRIIQHQIAETEQVDDMAARQRTGVRQENVRR